MPDEVSDRKKRSKGNMSIKRIITLYGKNCKVKIDTGKKKILEMEGEIDPDWLLQKLEENGIDLNDYEELKLNVEVERAVRERRKKAKVDKNQATLERWF